MQYISLKRNILRKLLTIDRQKCMMLLKKFITGVDLQYGFIKKNHLAFAWQDYIFVA